MTEDKTFQKLFDEFSNLNVMIIGDVMVDAYLWGKVERISPEAPVPIVAVEKREERLGGAANVALNVKALGAKPILCSVIGDDSKGDVFLKLLEEEGLTADGICRSNSRITTTKFRVLGNQTQMLRVDEEITSDLNTKDTNSLIERIYQIIDRGNIDIIVFQDYDKGGITRKVIAKVIAYANEKSIPVAVDPKRKNFQKYKNVTLFKPNLKELQEGLKTEINHKDIKELNQVVLRLQDNQNIQHALITLSEDGLYISSRTLNQRIIHSIPAHVRSIADVSGAGDTVISVAALCLASKCSPMEIATISNLAGGLVCEEVGVVPIKKEKLLAEVIQMELP
jgi:rfaE bifunctional protein kinase chain/domain